MMDGEPMGRGNQESTLPPDAPSPQGMLRWVEMFCWMSLVLTPLVYWMNGPTVSREQTYFRIGVVALLAVGGFSLRLCNYRNNRGR